MIYNLCASVHARRDEFDMKRFLHRIQPRRLLLTLLGTFLLQIVLLNVLSGLVANYLQLQFGEGEDLPWLIIVMFVVTAIVGLMCLVLALMERPKGLSVPAQNPPRYAGLIVIVGKRGTRDVDPDKLSHNSSIEYHLDEGNANGVALRVCWLIASAGESGSVDIANRVKERYGTRCHIEVYAVQDAFHVQDTYKIVRHIYENEARKYNLMPEEILADFTGGTTPMSVGLALAAEQHPMQYMYGGRADIKSEPISIRLERS